MGHLFDLIARSMRFPIGLHLVAAQNCRAIISCRRYLDLGRYSWGKDCADVNPLCISAHKLRAWARAVVLIGHTGAVGQYSAIYSTIDNVSQTTSGVPPCVTSELSRRAGTVAVGEILRISVLKFDASSNPSKWIKCSLNSGRNALNRTPARIVQLE